MRIVLKTLEGYIPLYWIKYTGTTITGWISGDLFKHDLKVSNETSIDIHFTYPKDGNVHNSYKIISSEKEIYISIFPDQIKTKVIENGKRVITEEKRTYQSKIPLSIFVPQVKQPSLDSLAYYQFTTVGFSIVEGKYGMIDKTKTILKEEIEKDDLIVDVCNFKNVSINLTAFVHKKDIKIGALPQSEFESLESSIDENRVIEVRCIIRHPKEKNSS